MRTLITQFVSDTEVRIQSLKESAEKGDGDAVKAIAHTLIGSAGSVGAMEMSRLAQELQELASRPGIAGVDRLTRQLEDVFLRTRDAFEAKYHLAEEK